MLGVYVRALLAFHRRCARRRGVRDGQGGVVTVMQRFGGGLNLNVHFHSLVLDGVFTENDDGALRFPPAPAPTDEKVARFATIVTRMRGLLRRRGVDDCEGGAASDQLAEESLALATLAGASVQSALGARAGRRVLRLGREPWA